MSQAPEADWYSLAQRTWLQSPPGTVDAETFRSQVWAPLEAAGFASSSLQPLENLQIVERHLWRTYSEQAPNQHVILLAAFLALKKQGNLTTWSILADRPADFSSLWHRVLSLLLDGSSPVASRLVLLEFVILVFQSLEKDFVRKQCAPLVSVAIWHNLHNQAARDKQLQKSAARQKAWKSVHKRLENASTDDKVRMQFDRAWLYSMVLDFLHRCQLAKPQSDAEVTYCERFLELLIDLISQLPTRRYCLVLLTDLNVVPVLRTCERYTSSNDRSRTFSGLVSLYEHFQGILVDDFGQSMSHAEPNRNAHYEALNELQRIAFQNFEQKLRVLALSNFASIDKPGELRSHISSLTDVELEHFCDLVGLRTSYPASSKVSSGRAVFQEALVATYARPRDFQQLIKQLSISPTEHTLQDRCAQTENYDGHKPLTLPKLNLQYLSLDDFMWRSFQLYQSESFHGISADIESVVRRMKPVQGRDSSKVHFEGTSKMGLPIEKPAIIEVGPPKVGALSPGYVRAEVILDVGRLGDRVRSEWDHLRPKDVVFLIATKPPRASSLMQNGKLQTSTEDDRLANRVRTAEVVGVLDDNGKPVRDLTNGYHGERQRRRLLLDLDPVAFHHDQALLARTKTDIWASIDVIVRRQGRENNFKAVLETIQNLVGSQTELPYWFQEVFLGYGDPKSASYIALPMRIERIDFLDTFHDLDHLRQSFPARKVQLPDTAVDLSPPYVLELFSDAGAAPPVNPKKRRRDQIENGEDIRSRPIQATTYRPPNTGPYLMDAPKKNKIRFTPKQVEAIVSGTQPGLSVIVGPPGTGKTDVATQIINLLYHNFPSERILLVAHSNQALNQLFQKIIALDIDSRHLLRLGRGEEELEAETSYSKYGRVESFLDNRQGFLNEVQRLANAIGAQGAHGSSCETASYFNQVFVAPAWSNFWNTANDESSTTRSIADAFPFKKFFANAPVPELFPESASPVEAKDIARGCQVHLDKLFAELESIRPFEILRNPRDQANHLLVREARIIAMTSTHAAMRRAEIANLGFHYDTLIMEEAAQVTEIESFIPCAMQNADPKTGELPLKRIVLIGDHLQNSPVIQNIALRQYANFEQSLFLRLIRLGVPSISLDQQGRCRPSMAELFNWRYENLTNLPHLLELPEFAIANAGFRREFQFIDVSEHQGHGEREPTPHFIQNLGEAEYAVALYQYMRLLGYPARSISILTTYAGQKALIRDVLEHRCKGNRLFGLPRIVTTVDKYQGEQNDYVILSLVRTKTVGYLRDIRRLTVALSRARLGLYILGRRQLFESCPEMEVAMQRLTASGSSKLELVTGEMYPTDRKIGADVPLTEMEGVEHLGQYVYEMTQAKVKSLGGQAVLEVDADADADADAGTANNMEDEIMEAIEDPDRENDPLHESI